MKLLVFVLGVAFTTCVLAEPLLEKENDTPSMPLREKEEAEPAEQGVFENDAGDQDKTNEVESNESEVAPADEEGDPKPRIRYCPTNRYYYCGPRGCSCRCPRGKKHHCVSRGVILKCRCIPEIRYCATDSYYKCGRFKRCPCRCRRGTRRCCVRRGRIHICKCIPAVRYCATNGYYNCGRLAKCPCKCRRGTRRHCVRRRKCFGRRCYNYYLCRCIQAVRYCAANRYYKCGRLAKCPCRCRRGTRPPCVIKCYRGKCSFYCNCLRSRG